MTQALPPGFRFVLFCALSVLSGCSGEAEEGHDHDEHDEATVGEESGATCPENSTLTYESFGKSFFDTYCTSCHSSELAGSERNGAPSDHNFDSIQSVRAVTPSHIDAWAAAGPSSVNEFMPPEDAVLFPSEQERRDLGEWLACGTP